AEKPFREEMRGKHIIEGDEIPGETGTCYGRWASPVAEAGSSLRKLGVVHCFPAPQTITDGDV
ncbi:MAG: hypothetical protein ACP5KV_08390, partial [Candidatus Methanomethylicaceae archaeon]